MKIPFNPSAIAPASSTGTGGSTGKSFGDAVSRALESLGDGLNASDKGAEDVAKGEGDVQDAVLGMVRAELDLRVALAIRDRLVEAYRELERMSL
jgi:flagellar hook-basal body complex protein FliE